MRIGNAKVTDIALTHEFVADYKHAPSQVKKALDKLVRMLQESCTFPNSMNVHPAESLPGMYIGYITRTKTHWRVLFYVEEVPEGSNITFYRLAGHDRMDIILKELVK